MFNRLKGFGLIAVTALTVAHRVDRGQRRVRAP